MGGWDCSPLPNLPTIERYVARAGLICPRLQSSRRGREDTALMGMEYHIGDEKDGACRSLSVGLFSSPGGLEKGGRS